jgi:hypothetical protein
MFEVIVRPVVFPNIRPAPARALAPEANPDQGIAVLNGSGGKLIDLPRSWSASTSQRVEQKETKRQYDTQRVYQKDKDGTINKDNFFDLEHLKKVRLDDGTDQGAIRVIYSEPPPVDNVETTGTDLVRNS